MQQNASPDYPVLDGFLLDTKVRCNLKFRSIALTEWDRIRRAGSYKYKVWVCPSSNEIVIPAQDSYEKELKAVPGSAIWGFSFVFGTNPGPFSFNIRDACTDVWGWSEVVRGDRFNTPTQHPFGKLLVVSAPGLITVEIASLQATDASGVQLLLHGGEPVC